MLPILKSILNLLYLTHTNFENCYHGISTRETATDSKYVRQVQLVSSVEIVSKGQRLAVSTVLLVSSK